MAQKNSFFLPDKKQKGKKVNNNETKNLKSETKKKRLDNYDTNRDGLSEVQQEQKDGEKKPFDKKAYRLKKYSKKYKLQQFEEQRKKKIMQNYHKSLKNDMVGSYKPKAFDEDTTDSSQHGIGKFVRHPDLIKEGTRDQSGEKPKREAFWKAKEQFKIVKQEKLDKQKQIEKAQQEKAQKYAEYKKKKQERFKKLSVKNKKGQPVMALRMELLLNKLQSSSS